MNQLEETVNLLVVGGIGVGKTTLIDAFTNYVLGIELDDAIRYKLVDERAVEKDKIEAIASEQGNSGSIDSLRKSTRKATVHHIPSKYIINGLQK